jgi:hypothetical protein
MTYLAFLTFEHEDKDDTYKIVSIWKEDIEVLGEFDNLKEAQKQFTILSVNHIYTYLPHPVQKEIWNQTKGYVWKYGYRSF